MLTYRPYITLTVHAYSCTPVRRTHRTPARLHSRMHASTPAHARTLQHALHPHMVTCTRTLAHARPPAHPSGLAQAPGPRTLPFGLVRTGDEPQSSGQRDPGACGPASQGLSRARSLPGMETNLTSPRQRRGRMGETGRYRCCFL